MDSLYGNVNEIDCDHWGKYSFVKYNGDNGFFDNFLLSTLGGNGPGH